MARFSSPKRLQRVAKAVAVSGIVVLGCLAGIIGLRSLSAQPDYLPLSHPAYLNGSGWLDEAHPSLRSLVSQLDNLYIGTPFSQLPTSTINPDTPLADTCGSWVSSYAQTHKDSQSQTNSQTHPRFLISTCPLATNCGGLADRIMGISSAFIIALLTNRIFLLRWDTFVQPRDLFDAPNINWEFNASKHQIPENSSLTLNTIHFGARRIESVFLNESIEATLQATDHISFISNRGITSRLFKHPKYGPQLIRMGLTNTTAFPCIYHFLFSPHSRFHAFMARYAYLLRHPDVFAVGLQIRTGDASIRTPLADMSSIHHFKQFFACAFQIHKRFATLKQRLVVFLVTDSYRLRYEALRTYPKHMLVTGLPISHMHKSPPKVADAFPKKALRNMVHHYSSIIESELLSIPRFKIISQGGFGKLSVFRSALEEDVDHRTVLMRPWGNSDLKKLPTKEGCEWSSYEELASSWSLG